MRPRTAVLLAFIGLVGVGVPLNALYFQDGRHPAPLFKSALLFPQTSPQVQAQRPNPPAPEKTAAAKSEAAKAPAVKPEPARGAEKPSHDEIGMLISGGAPKTPPKAAEKADKSVLFAQKALAKLGYPLKPDGVPGGSTRQAIEKFERANGLPVKGDITPKILRQLASRSGLSRD